MTTKPTAVGDIMCLSCETLQLLYRVLLVCLCVSMFGWVGWNRQNYKWEWRDEEKRIYVLHIIPVYMEKICLHKICSA